MADHPYLPPRETIDPQPECELCREKADWEMGEFWDPAKGSGVWAHGQCGIDAGLEFA